MDYLILLIPSAFSLILIVSVVVFLVIMIKNGGFSTKAAPQITMREGEVSLLATQVVWMHKKIYLNKHSIPHGVLDITNQRVVYTRLSGAKVDFALEKSEIEGVFHRGKIGVKIQAKDGTDYVINIMPPKHVEDALERMGVPVHR